MQINPHRAGKTCNKHPNGEEGAKFRSDTGCGAVAIGSGDERLDFGRDLDCIVGSIIARFDDALWEDGGSAFVNACCR